MHQIKEKLCILFFLQYKESTKKTVIRSIHFKAINYFFQVLAMFNVKHRIIVHLPT